MPLFFVVLYWCTFCFGSSFSRHDHSLDHTFFSNIIVCFCSYYYEYEYEAVTQVVRGVAAVPQAVLAPRQGKWWNESTRTWVYTDMTLVEFPENDDDLLQGLESELYAAAKPTGDNAGSVKDTYYYDTLEVSLESVS